VHLGVWDMRHWLLKQVTPLPESETLPRLARLRASR
jgi:hypothetical protein